LRAQVESPLQDAHSLAARVRLGRGKVLEEGQEGLKLGPALEIQGTLDPAEGDYRLDLGLHEHLVQGTNDVENPPVQLYALDEAVEEDVEVGALIGQRVGQGVQAQQACEEEA